MNDRAPSFVAAAVSHIGNVRQHNEDAHLVDVDHGTFMVCDGMGGHAAGEVASALAVAVVGERWSGAEVDHAVGAWAAHRTAEARRALFNALRVGVLAAHERIVAESDADPRKRGMGTTFLGLKVAGGDAVLAHAGDSRAYLVRDGIAIQLTEDHTLLARLASAGIDIAAIGSTSRWKGVLTNALGMGEDTRIATFAVPLAGGDRFLLCTDGVSEYVDEAEVGEVLSTLGSPEHAAQRLIDFALERGGADNATAVVIEVIEPGVTQVPVAQRQRDDAALARSPLLAGLTAPQRLRALRIALERELPAGSPVPAEAFGDRIAWIVLDGEVDRAGTVHRAGDLVYPGSLLAGNPRMDRAELGVTLGDVRALAIRRDDFGELTSDEPDLAAPLFHALGELVRR